MGRAVGPRSGSRSRSVSVREELLSWIARGGVAPGGRLPPEPQLAAEFGVARSTLREALRSLEDEGVVTRTPGAGTFLVHRSKVQNNLDLNFGVSDAIRAAGMLPGNEEGVTQIARAGGAEAERLGIDPTDDVVVLERVRTADGRRVVFTKDILPASLVAGRAEVLPHLSTGSVYEVMERDLGITIHHGVASFAPAKASHAIAAKLGVRKGTLLLYISQVDYDDEGRAVLSSHEHHLADAFEFTVVRRGPGRRFT